MTCKTLANLTADFLNPSQAQWRALVDKAIKGADFDTRLVSKTLDGVTIAPLYTANVAHQSTPAPHARPEGAWDIRQRLANPDATQSNHEALADLAGGVSSFTLQIAAPGQFGLSPRKEGLARALDGVILDAVPIALDAGGAVLNASGTLMALWEERRIAQADRKGAFNADPLGQLARHGSIYHDLPRALALAAQLALDAQAMPGVTALLADGRIMHAAGGSEAQELAFVLASVTAYLRACEPLGMKPAQALPKIAVAVATDSDQILTICKLRALRVLIERVGEACGVEGAGTRIHVTAETASRMLAKLDCPTNILRCALATASAAMGGADAITCSPFTAALGLPDPHARRIARNTQIVLMEESGLGRVSDPLSGAYAFEAITADLAAHAWALFQGIERERSGDLQSLPAALLNCSFAASVSNTARLRATQIATGEVEIVGVSAYPDLSANSPPAAPFPKVPEANLPGAQAPALKPISLAAPFEALRERVAESTVRGFEPVVFLAVLGEPAKLQPQTAFVSNLLASAGLSLTPPVPFTHAADVVAAFSKSGARCAVIVGGEVPYATPKEVASLLKKSHAVVVLMAGRSKPADLAALNAAGVDHVLYRGMDRPRVLDDVLSALDA